MAGDRSIFSCDVHHCVLFGEMCVVVGEGTSHPFLLEFFQRV